MGLWVAASGYFFGGELALSNMVIGALIAFFSAWAGIIAKRLRK